MNLDYKVVSWPNRDQTNYFQAYLEGNLRIYIQGKLYFEESNFLLAEFAYALKKWFLEIEQGKNSNFIYETMDSNETPILLLKNTVNGIFIKSAWEKFECTEIFEKDRVMEKLNSFVEGINELLELKLNVSLNE